MHNESMMVAGFLAVIAVGLASRKGHTTKRVGMVFAVVSALMLIAGLT